MRLGLHRVGLGRRAADQAPHRACREWPSTEPSPSTLLPSARLPPALACPRQCKLHPTGPQSCMQCPRAPTLTSYLFLPQFTHDPLSHPRLLQPVQVGAAPCKPQQHRAAQRKRCTNGHSRQACPTLNPPASSPVTAPRKRRRACAIMLLAMLPAPSSDGPCAPAGRCGSECTDPASLVGSAKDPPPSLEPSLPAWLHASLACSPATQSALSAAAMHAAA